MFKKILFSFVTLYTIGGFFLLPYLLKPEIVKNANKYIDGNLSIENISFNPYILKFKLDGIKLTQHTNQILFINELSIDLEPHQLFTQTLYLKELVIRGMDLHIQKDKHSTLNLATLLKPQPETQQKEQPSQPINLNELPHIYVKTLGIDESHILFDDNSKITPFHFVLNNFRLLLNDFDSKKLTNSDANIRILAKLEDGGLIDIKTALTKISSNPLNGIQTQTVAHINIPRLYNEWRYIRDTLKLEVADGSLNLNTKIALNTKNIDATHIYDTSLLISNLRIKPKKKNKDILNLKSLTLTQLDTKPLKKKIIIDALTLDTLNIKAIKLKKNGTIDWQNYLQSRSASAKKKTISKEKKEPTQPVDFLLKHFTLKNSTILFKDKHIKPQVDITLDHITLKADHITLAKETPFNYTFTTKINKNATLKANGKLSLTPLRQQGNVSLQHLALKFLNPYIAQSSYIKLQDGYLNFSTQESFEAKKEPLYTAKGKVSLDEFFVNDTRDNKSLLSLSHFNINDFSLESKTNKLIINNALLDAFYVDAMVAKNKEFNLAKLTKEQTTHKQKTTSKKSQQDVKKEPFKFLLKKLTIKDGSAKFADLSLALPFRTDIHDLNGALYTLTNIAHRKTALKLNGEIDRYGATKIDIKTDASNPKKFTQVAMNFSNLNMHSLSGYSATFAGHKIDDGKLYLNLNYNLNNSKIQGDNSIIIKKIKIGEELKDTNATSLPLGFIVALLEDKDGIIDIDMPVEGDVDAPNFKYGSFIFKTFFNLLVKAVVSPFSFLGSMMGIDSEKLKSVDFEAGSSVILPPQREKLDQLTKMLIKRPKISLSIQGSYNTATDKKTLQAHKLLQEATPFTKEKKPLENESELTLVLLEKIYLKHAKKATLQKLKKVTKKEHIKEVLLNKTTQLMPISKKELLILATQRAAKVQHYLIQKGIVKKRLKLLQADKSDTEENMIPTAIEIIVK